MGPLVSKKKIDKDKLIQSQQKLSMGLKRRSELNVELDILTKKKKALTEE